jgi:hypothetical protein
MGDNGEHTHDTEPTVPIVTPVVDTGERELIDPVINLTERATRIEEQQARHQEELVRQLGELETRLANASSSQVDSLRERIASLEAKLEAATPPDVPESVELTVPDIEASPAPPEKERRGLRHRRKAKRGK